jgi:hypothetical protein
MQGIRVTFRASYWKQWEGNFSGAVTVLPANLRFHILRVAPFGVGQFGLWAANLGLAPAWHTDTLGNAGELRFPTGELRFPTGELRSP